jgi:hypothetical protein
MKDKLIIEDYDEPVQSLTFFNFIYNQDDNNNNNDHLLCGIIEDLWASEDSFIENIFKPQNNCSKKNCSNNEEINELQAYLYEIDMNLEYFRNDYREFKNYDLDINIDKLLSFSCSQDACNMLIYETEISYKLRLGTNKIQLSDIFAHVEDIPEFIPINYSNDISSDTEVLDEHQLIYDDDGILVDEFLNDDFQVGVGGDIFENVYNYIPDGDGDEDEEDEEEIGVSTTSSDDNSSGSAKKTMSKKSQKSLSAYYFRKKLALQLDIDNSSSSSSASSLTNIPNAVLNGSKFLPRLIKSNKDNFRKPCVYMLNEGRCMRSDCRFAHDLHNITCKYWLEGECLKGESCEFLHDFTESTASSLSKAEKNADQTSSSTTTKIPISKSGKKRQKAKDFSLNNLDFPELSASATSNKPDSTSMGTSVEYKSNSDNNQENDNIADYKQSFEEQQLKVINNSNKKTRRIKNNVLYTLTLPSFQLSSRKKNIK